ncbi:MAG: leucine-rich repeat protein [Roseburia sp.]
MKKRVIALLLAAIMLVPTGYQGVSAAESGTEQEVTESTEATEAIDETEEAEATEAVEETEVAEATEAVEETEVAEATEAVEETEVAEATEAVEETEVAEATEIAEETETAEPEEADAAATEISEETECAEEPEYTEATEEALEEEKAVDAEVVEDAGKLATTYTEGDFSYQVSNSKATITKYNGAGGAVSIPDKIGGYTVTAIGRQAFKNVTALTSVTIPDTVTEIAAEAFYNTGLTSIKLPASLETLGYSIIAKTSVAEITIPKSLKNLPSDNTGALSGCETLKKVVFADGSTTVTRVCRNSPYLTQVVIPDTVTKIENYAFKDCNSLASITIPANVKEIGVEAFRNTALTSLTLPDGIEKLGTGMIDGTKITEIAIPSSLKEGGMNADGRGAFGILSRCETLKKVVFKEGITTIPPKVCYYCTSATEIVIPSSVTKIGDYAFTACTGMTEFTLPTGVTDIGYQAFAKNENLAKVVIYDKVTTIHSTAFEKSTQCKIIGYRNSTAETFAKENSLTFESIKYDIKFDGNSANGGSTKTMSSRECGVSYALTANGFTKTGYKFKGWNTKKDGKGTSYSNQAEVINLCPLYNAKGSSITLYAQWEPIKYTIQFDRNGADKGSMDKMTSLRYDKSYELKSNAFKKTGYKFTGWNTKQDGSGTTYKNAAAIKNLTTKDGATVKLYAQWKIETYSIKYELNGGKNNSKNPSSYKVNTKTIELSNPTRSGYTFAGWYSDKKLTKKVTKISKGSTGNKTLYAKWTANKYNIKFDGNGAKSGSTKQIKSVKYGSEVKLTSNGFKRTGYEFVGWNTKKDGTGTTYKNKAAVKNLTTKNGKTVTLYAQWKLKKYDITYELNGGKNSSKNPATYTMKTKTIKLANPTRKGYTFKGWYSDSKFKNRVKTIESGSTGNVKLYAKWQKK